ncbi:DUF1295-domain-containing protein [Rhizophagus irregularis]|uniref:DUF1295-domain-containing protein n=1 Tax=Rhizophagus irregularis TaxID=588596 RepID=A0A2N1MUQ7_9GLOM|nr:DUF1295-domain-containing protein [Rhizophagus irregularis]
MAVKVLDDYYLAITAIITIGYQLIFFSVSYGFQIDSVTDFGGGSNVAILAILTLIFCQTWYVRQIVATIFAVIWGVRLGLFCLYRMLKSGHDSRFDNIRGSFKSLLFFYIFQMMWVWTISLPVIFLNSPRISGKEEAGKDVEFGSVTDIIGIIIFSIGILIESIADIQKFVFRQRRTSPVQFINTGLWAWSRHPNYFGEMMVRLTGMFLLCLQPTITGVGTNAAYASIASPAFTIFILMFLSGMPLNERPAHEKQWKNGNWPEYSKHLKRTSVLIPFPPFLYEPLPQIIKSTLFLEFPIYRFVPDSESRGLTKNDTNVDDTNGEGTNGDGANRDGAGSDGVGDGENNNS